MLQTKSVTINKFKDLIFRIISLKPFRFLITIFAKKKFKNLKTNSIKPLNLNIKNDLIIIYRVCPFNNGKSPVFTNDKYKLFCFCLDSLLKSFTKTKPYFIFILDSCPQSYPNYIKKYHDLEYQILPVKNAGNLSTWLLQLDIASKLNPDKLIYFAEDDYYYRENAGEKLKEGIKKYDFFSLHNRIDDRKVKKAGFYQTDYTCLTFGAKAKIIQNKIEILQKYATFDYTIWLEVKETNFKLYTYIPTLATHLVKGKLSKGVIWDQVWQKDLQKYL
ncbi:hypothetical protein GYA19_00900 [Candidatus Beckwithbacteria bacterium]|nr:hypothetical protein [Candidatus Beckwithbacteria bacterium]